jgi:signal transduction histidine kinase
MDANGRVIRDPKDDDLRDRGIQNPDVDSMSLADLLPQSATSDLIAAIRAAADTGNAQFLEFDLLSEDGVRRIHAEAASDPDHQGEFVVTAREYSPTHSPESQVSEERSQAAERFAAMAAETSDPGAVFQAFAGVLAERLPYDRLSVVTVDHDRDEQRVIFSTDADQDAVIPLSGTAIEIVSRINEPLAVPAAIPSVIVTPLRASGEVVAYLSLHANAWESFSDHDLGIVVDLCPPLAAALGADQHRKSAARTMAEQSALESISAITATAGDLRTMLEVTVDRVHRSGRFAFVRAEAATTAKYAISGPEIMAARGEAPPASAEAAPEVVVESYTPGKWTIGATSEPLGLISVQPVDVGGIDQTDDRFLAECARRLAQGIARLRSEQELERLRLEIDSSREIERVTAGLSDLDALVEMAAEEIKRFAGPVSLVVRVNLPGVEQVRLEHRVNVSSQQTPQGDADPFGESSAVVPLLSPAGIIGEVSASWRNAEDTRAGLRRLEAMTPRLAERIHALLLMESSAALSRDSTSLAELEAAIEHCADPGLALEEATSVLSDRLGGARVSISRLVDGNEALSELSVSGLKIDGWSAGASRPLAGSLEESAALASGPISSSGASPDALVASWPAEAMAVGAGIRSLASVVLPTGAEVSAWLSARSPRTPDFSDGDIELLRRAAALIAGPVLRLCSESASTTDSAPGSDWETMARIGHLSQSSPGLEVSYSRLAAELASVVEFDQIEVAILGPAPEIGRRVYLGGKPVPGWEQGSEFRLSGTVAETVIRSRAGMFLSGESPAGLASKFPVQAAALAAELRSFVGAPLVINDEPVGSLVVRSTDPAAYSRRELAIVEAVAVHMSSAIARGRLREQIERQRRESEALASIGSSWDLEPDVAAERAAIAFRRLVECDGLVVTTVSADADTVRVVVAHGVDEAEEQFFAGRIDRLRSKSDSPGSRSTDNYASSLRARIGPMSRPLGYIHAFSSRPDAFTSDDSDLLQRVGERLGSVFERVRAADHSSRLSAEQGLRRKLDAQNRELRELTISRDRFLKTIVHELHTPLMSVQLITDLLMQNAPSNLGEEQMAQLGLIADSGERLQDLVGNLLDVSQIQSDTFELAYEEFDSSPLIRDICQSFSGLLAVRGQRLELSRPDEPLWLNADPARFSSMMSNLISNACKYSDDGTAIRIQVDREGSQLHIAIIDPGIGISEDDLARLFAPFERGTNPDALRLPRTGLGLVIARSIARLHGGDLTLESGPGAGTTARFHIEGVHDGPSEAYQASVAARTRNLES